MTKEYQILYGSCNPVEKKTRPVGCRDKNKKKKKKKERNIPTSGFGRLIFSLDVMTFLAMHSEDRETGYTVYT